MNLKYAAKKAGSAIVLILIVSALVFWAFSVIPGDPALAKLGTQATPEALSALRHKMGLDQPLWLRYLQWMKGILMGDLGASYTYDIPVSQLLSEKVPTTLMLALLSFLLAAGLGIWAGTYSAKHTGGVFDRVMVVINQVVMSVPAFFFGLLMTWLFGLVLHFFVPGDFVSYRENFPRFLGQLFFPALAAALPRATMAAKLLRTSILEESTKDYVRTAYSRGNDTSGVLKNHVLKNALLPVITFLGMTFADLIAGSIIIEQVFSVPGVGRALLSAISNRDYPVVMAVILLITVCVVVTNGLVDILYKTIDPRTEK